MSLKFSNFVLVQATQSNVLRGNGCPPETKLLYTAMYAQLFISRFTLVTLISMMCIHLVVSTDCHPWFSGVGLQVPGFVICSLGFVPTGRMQKRHCQVMGAVVSCTYTDQAM